MSLSVDTIASRVLYRDGLTIILDKPAGIPVHAGPSKKANLEQYFEGLRFGFPRPPGLAHRLDRDTSGCLVLGRHPKALRRLGKLFADGLAQKTYWAVVEGRPPEPKGRIDLPLLRVPSADRRGWLSVVDKAGQEAVTDYETLGSTGDFTWLALFPRTGRTHQLRIHCISLGCPIVGEPHYGQGRTKGQGILHLQSRSIELPLYPKRDPIVATAPPPPHMKNILAQCGLREGQ